jgi:hypothetical protein
MRLSATRLRATGGAIARGGTGFDAAAAAYIAAVEAADGQSLEAGVKTAINTFVVGCKADGIWDAIKASCILSGARTLSGALVPLAGTGPTNNNFVSGDYDRKTGLVGNGSSKYLNSNRAGNADPQNNCHLAVWKADAVSGTNPYFIGCGSTAFNAIGQDGMYSNSSTVFADTTSSNSSSAQGLHGHSRSSSSSVNFKRPGFGVLTASNTSTTPPSFSHFVFAFNSAGTPIVYTASRLAFYSIGEALDLALLDARVTTLISAYAAALP